MGGVVHNAMLQHPVRLEFGGKRQGKKSVFSCGPCGVLEKGGRPMFGWKGIGIGTPKSKVQLPNLEA